MNIILLSLFFLFVITTCDTASDIPTCQDEDGNPVDWYIAYKFPSLSNQEAPFNSGYAYAFITSESVKQKDPTTWSAPKSSYIDGVIYLNYLRDLLLKYNEYFVPFNKQKPKGSLSKITAKSSGKRIKDDLYWTISGKLITDPKSVVLRTLEIAYFRNKSQQSNNINSIFYNDQPPQKLDEKWTVEKSGQAHAKGTILIDDITGDSVWLTHSTPLFPPPRNMNLKFGTNSKIFGQTFMCLNFDSNRSGRQIIEHLVNMDPLIYDSQISERLRSMIPEIENLTLKENRKYERKVSKTQLSQVITTKAGQKLSIYSKSAKFGEDLYSNWIDEDLKTALYVETFRNGAGRKLNSSCPRNDYNVNNVQDLKINDGETQITWTYHQDHSKWAISDHIDSGVVCISDINRMESQFKRGGGAVCIKCPSCWSVFSDTILDLEPCPIYQE